MGVFSVLNWTSFLVSQGAYIDAQGEVNFQPLAAAASATYLMPLQQALLSIQGVDAATFLQGQVTCDVRELAEQKTLLGAQCNIKGRMLLCFRALQPNAEQIILRLGQGLVSFGLANLGKYIVFSKAKLADLSPDFCCIGIAGGNASLIIKTVFGLEIQVLEQWQSAGNSVVIRLSENRYECWLAVIDAEKIWLQLAPHCQLAGQNLWNLLNIQAGIGDITPATYEAFTPQAINLQLVNGINFRKGCYTGQEIVARLHYRGNLKRHMYRFEYESAGQALPAPGSELHNGEGKAVGEVVLAAYKNAKVIELLASVVDAQCDDLFRAGYPQKLSLLPLPYAIPTLENTDE
jgi:tRNA-modifying protein YgfZ